MHDSWLCTVLFGLCEKHHQHLNSQNIYLEIQGLKLVFPVDNSLQGCYKDRASCVARDFQGEVSFLRFLTNREIYLPFFQLDHLLTSFSDLWDFGQKWFGLYDKVEEMAVEGQLWSMVMQSIYFFQTFRPLCFRSIQLCSLASSRQTLKYIVLSSPHTFLAYSKLFSKN